jgi:DNA-binding protein YbaB
VAGFIDGELAMWRETGIFGDEQKLALKSVTPSWTEKGEAVEVTIEGNALQSVKKVTVGGTVVEHDTSDDGKTLTAKVPSTLKEGLHNVEVESTGMNTATLINGMRIGGDEPSMAAKSSGCSARPTGSPLGGLALLSMIGVVLGLRRRAY